MSIYRKVSVQVWGDAKFSSLSNEGKLAFLFILTHPNMTGVGAMRATVEGLRAELGVSQEAFQEPFDLGLVKVSAEAPLVVLPRFVKHNRPESPNVCKSWAKVLELLPECALLDEHMNLVLRDVQRLGKAFTGAFREAFTEDYTESGTGTGTGTEVTTSTTHSTPERPDNGSAAKAASPDDEDFPFLSMPLREGGQYVIPETKIREWQSAFPGLDVREHLGQACQWARDNKSRRKTLGGVEAFFGRWLAKARDGPPGRASKTEVTDRSVAMEYADDDPFKPG